MIYFLLCFSFMLSVHFPPWKLSYAADIENNRMIDDIIDKLLRSEKFEQLASKIAEKAAERIIQIQDGNVTSNIKGDPIYRVANNITGSKKHSSDLNIEGEETSSLIDRLLYPFDNLTLKYSTLIENNPDDNKNVKHGVRSKKAGKQQGKKSKKNTDKITHESYTKGYSDDTDKGKKKTKLRNAEKVLQSKENGQTTTKNNIEEESSDANYPSESSFEGFVSFPNTTVMLTSDDEKDYTQTSKEIIDKQLKNHSQVNIEYKNGDTNSSNVKTKRILGMENQRLYVVASSSEYQDYRDDFFQ